MLAGNVSAEIPVLLGALASADEADTPQGGLRVEPLQKWGGWQDGDLPRAIADILFALPEAADGDPLCDGATGMPPLQTFAILDAAKFGGGASEIECCDMPFR
ncbi:MAG: hypothetical protein Q4G25_03115 [Paracoccus sp. (in: a-proteobacteria)]|nr:hypothetical protein [Paracoccus sp. (in: a-proteobacteria)]